MGGNLAGTVASVNETGRRMPLHSKRILSTLSKKKMKKTAVNGTNLAYIEKGAGAPVVLVHGTLGDMRSWELQMDAFARHYRTIAYSRRYHYPNECNGNASDYSAVMHADDLSEFLKALGLESAYVVGNSYGAYTSLLLAARHPQQVRALVLSEPPVLPLLDHHEQGRAVRSEFLDRVWQPAGQAMQRGETEKGVQLFVDGVVNQGAFGSFPPEVRQLIMDNACEFKAETASPGFWTPFTCQEARQIATPTLLLTGQNSLKMLKLIMEELAGCMPGNDLVTVPSSSHETASENPEAYNQIVLDFLAKYTP